MLVERIKNEPVDSNCYVVYCEQLSSCIVVDPGTESCDLLLTFLSRHQIMPEFIIITHSHFDHIWGVNKVRKHYPLVQVICNLTCNAKIIDSKKNLSLFYDKVGFSLRSADLFIENLNFELKWKDLKVIFMNTPGHSDCSISFKINQYLFSGDLFLKDIPTITKLPGGSKQKLKETTLFFKETFSNKGMLVMPGHGDSYRFDSESFNIHLNL